ncbi:cullin-1-like [Aedes albopictus]|uniref:Cullin N-terminal domain-containing protein n=1 Tax=Aedes albopictus TaxID=7160 RepID=A0ABM1Z8F7_AEDAL
MSRLNSHGATGLRNINLEEIWADLEGGIKQVYKQEQSLSPARYMQLYTHVHNYCTSVHQQPTSRQTASKISKKGTAIPSGGAQLVGQELYKRLKEFLECYLIKLQENGIDLMDEEVLSFYTKRWEEYQLSRKVLNGLVRYQYLLPTYFQREELMIPWPG